MAYVPSGPFDTAFFELHARFGTRFGVRRESDGVWWTYDGLAVGVAPVGDLGVEIEARFVERPTRDRASTEAVAPTYVTARRYRLTSRDASAFASDVVAFFSGIREPRFAFVGFEPTGHNFERAVVANT